MCMNKIITINQNLVKLFKPNNILITGLICRFDTLRNLKCHKIVFYVFEPTYKSSLSTIQPNKQNFIP